MRHVADGRGGPSYLPDLAPEPLGNPQPRGLPLLPVLHQQGLEAGVVAATLAHVESASI